MRSNVRRPVGVMLFAVMFLWIGGFGTLFFPLIALTGGVSDLVKLWPGSAFHSQSALRLISYVLGTAWYFCYLAYLVIGIGLIKLKNWARKSVVGIALFGMGASLIVVFVFVRPFLLATAGALWCSSCCGWSAWYLVRPRVRYAFGAWRKYTPEGKWVEPPGLPTRAKVATGIAVPLTTVGVFATLLFFAINSMLHSSGAYRVTMNAASASPCVVNALGGPLKTGWMSGNIEEGSQKGAAEFKIPVEGPKGKGNLEAEAKKLDGEWKVESLVLTQNSRSMQVIPAQSGCP
ncbi:MAG TPA: cytochrome c oxidase assembly factor Coa1 family protein [Terracidiphilus sp.]|nr:cytochrome c oxidase assembly factor Coa1 family protein [Terracidiphilus sp.]